LAPTHPAPALGRSSAAMRRPEVGGERLTTAV
jgi:hypothetical protein